MISILSLILGFIIQPIDWQRSIPHGLQLLITSNHRSIDPTKLIQFENNEQKIGTKASNGQSDHPFLVGQFALNGRPKNKTRISQETGLGRSNGSIVQDQKKENNCTWMMKPKQGNNRRTMIRKNLMKVHQVWNHFWRRLNHTIVCRGFE